MQLAIALRGTFSVFYHLAHVQGINISGQHGDFHEFLPNRRIWVFADFGSAQNECRGKYEQRIRDEYQEKETCLDRRNITANNNL